MIASPEPEILRVTPRSGAWQNPPSVKGLRVVTGETIVVEGESLFGGPAKVLGAYGRVGGGDYESILGVKVEPSKRTNGLVTNSRSAGTISRNVIRGDYCSLASLALENPVAHEAIERLGGETEATYRRLTGSPFEIHDAEARARFEENWRLRGGVFTTATVNRDSAVGYHLDTGNLPGRFAGCTFLSRDCEGGLLCVPEWGLAFEPRDGWTALFDGQAWIHGVSPFSLGDGGYRVSVVFYTFRDVWRCLPPDEELRRYQTEKTRRERNLVGRNFYQGTKPEIRGEDTPVLPAFQEIES